MTRQMVGRGWVSRVIGGVLDRLVCGTIGPWQADEYETFRQWRDAEAAARDEYGDPWTVHDDADFVAGIRGDGFELDDVIPGGYYGSLRAWLR